MYTINGEPLSISVTKTPNGYVISGSYQQNVIYQEMSLPEGPSLLGYCLTDNNFYWIGVSKEITDVYLIDQCSSVLSYFYDQVFS